MKNTVAYILNDSRYDRACTYIVRCMGETEIYTRENVDKMIRDWGKEEATIRFRAVNSNEVVISIL